MNKAPQVGHRLKPCSGGGWVMRGPVGDVRVAVAHAMLRRAFGAWRTRACPGKTEALRSPSTFARLRRSLRPAWAGSRSGQRSVSAACLAPSASLCASRDSRENPGAYVRTHPTNPLRFTRAQKQHAAGPNDRRMARPRVSRTLASTRRGGACRRCFKALASTGIPVQRGRIGVHRPAIQHPVQTQNPRRSLETRLGSPLSLISPPPFWKHASTPRCLW